MIIKTFEKQYIEQAKEIALSNYYEEREYVRELPQFVDFPDLAEFAENGLGVAAFENEKMLGFLCCCNPWKNAFNSTATGTFSPIHSHGAVFENRIIIYKRLYQAAAEKWVTQKITSHAIALYAHDKQALDTFFMYGFGARCVDAIRTTTNIPVVLEEDLIFRELPKEEIIKIRDMRKFLSEHMAVSPCFMRDTQQEIMHSIERAENRKSKVYVAQKNHALISFIEIKDGGENFITESECMMNICGAFCMPEYRGKGVFQGLLNYVMEQLRQKKINYLGVDYESFNPTANRAWGKYFTPYTHSVVRRIDECALID